MDSIFVYQLLIYSIFATRGTSCSHWDNKMRLIITENALLQKWFLYSLGAYLAALMSPVLSTVNQMWPPLTLCKLHMICIYQVLIATSTFSRTHRLPVVDSSSQCQKETHLVFGKRRRRGAIKQNICLDLRAQPQSCCP